jgi:A/G-specific adenine glycosylase
MLPGKFHTLVLNWFDHHGRKNLPWQLIQTPYHVWISEIMLQQTQVMTVIPYFEKFIKRFPNVKKLALAKTDDVLAHWSGLGYYARARNLHKTAQIILNEYQEKFPNNLEDLQKLPGIGRSTAGAILALGMQKPASILDGNVKRVLCRFHAIDELPSKPHVIKKLWELAEKYTPQKRVADYTQAMMDLGAMVCTRNKPKCEYCPLQKNCLGFKKGNPCDYPIKKISKKIPIKSTYLLILYNQQGEILLEKRPPVGIWGGLWSFPECSLNENISQWCEKNYSAQISRFEPWPQLRHTFTHFHLDIVPVLGEINQWTPPLMESERIIWYKAQQKNKKGFPAPIVKLLKRFNEKFHSFG